jgi:hypothetical protein|nr:MAG TPA: hypothetical protein [Caudoviricetes sp.]
MSDLAVELGKKLKSVYNNDDFITAVLSYADNEADQRSVIEFIDNGEDVTDENVLIFAMELADAHDK